MNNLRDKLKKLTLLKAKEQLQKDVGQLKFPNLKGINTRPDQEVMPIANDAQREIAKKVVQNAIQRHAKKLGKPDQDAKIIGENAANKMPLSNESPGATVGANRGSMNPKAFAIAGHNYARDHEAIHHSLKQIKAQYGSDAHNNTIDGLLGHFHPHDVEAARHLMHAKGYRDLGNKEELITHLHDISSNPEARSQLSNSMDFLPESQSDHPDKFADAHMYSVNRIRQGWNNARNYAHQLRHEDLKGQPLSQSEKLFKDEPPLKLTHYSPIKGLKAIDPAHMGSSGVKSGGQYKYAIPETKTSFHYLDNTTPEDVVSEKAKSKYTSQIDPAHLYSLSHDHKGIAKEAVKRNNGVWDTDQVLSAVKNAGYKGVWAPEAQNDVIRNTVQLFHPHKVNEEKNT